MWDLWVRAGMLWVAWQPHHVTSSSKDIDVGMATSETPAETVNSTRQTQPRMISIMHSKSGT